MAARHSQQSFVELSTLKHNGAYSYDDCVFISTNHKVLINCPIHGPFEQKAANHLRGDGCKLCTASGGRGMYSLKYFEKWPEERLKPAIMYVISMTHEGQQWIKVGITVSTVTDRFSKQIYKQMEIQCIKQLQMPLYVAFCWEQKIISDLAQHKFSHPIKFCGHSECFHDNIEVRNYLENI